MSLFAKPKRFKPQRVTRIISPRFESHHPKGIAHIIRSIAIDRGKGLDAYTDSFSDYRPVRSFELTDLPVWREAERHINRAIAAQEDNLRAKQLDTLLLAAQTNCQGLGASFHVIADGA